MTQPQCRRKSSRYISSPNEKPILSMKKLDLDALDNFNKFNAQYGCLFTVLGAIFDGKVSTLTSQQCEK